MINDEYDLDIDELHEGSLITGTHDFEFPNCHCQIKVIYIPSHYRTKLWWYEKDRTGQIAEWESIT